MPPEARISPSRGAPDRRPGPSVGLPGRRGLPPIGAAFPWPTGRWPTRTSSAAESVADATCGSTATFGARRLLHRPLPGGRGRVGLPVRVGVRRGAGRSAGGASVRAPALALPGAAPGHRGRLGRHGHARDGGRHRRRRVRAWGRPRFDAHRGVHERGVRDGRRDRGGRRFRGDGAAARRAHARGSGRRPGVGDVRRRLPRRDAHRPAPANSYASATLERGGRDRVPFRAVGSDLTTSIWAARTTGPTPRSPATSRCSSRSRTTGCAHRDSARWWPTGYSCTETSAGARASRRCASSTRARSGASCPTRT